MAGVYKTGERTHCFRIQIIVLQIHCGERLTVGQGVDAAIACQLVLATNKGRQGGAVLEAREAEYLVVTDVQQSQPWNHLKTN